VAVLQAQLDLERARHEADRLRWTLGETELLMTTLLQIIGALREIIVELDGRQYGGTEDELRQAYAHRRTAETQLDRVNDRRRHLELLWELARAGVHRLSAHPDVTVTAGLPGDTAWPSRRPLVPEVLVQPALADIAAALSRAEQLIAEDERAARDAQPPSGPEPLGPEDEFAVLLSATRLRDPGSRRMAVDSLIANWLDRPATRAVLVGLAGDPDEKVRLCVVEGLSRDRSSERAVHDALIRLLRDTSISVHRLALSCLTRTWPGDPEVRDVLVSLLSRLPREARRRSVEALSEGWRGDPTARDAVAALSGDEDRRVREALVRALATGWPGDAVARDAVSALTGDEDRRVREAAIMALVRAWSQDDRVRASLLTMVCDRNLRIRERIPTVIAAALPGDPVAAAALRVLLADRTPTVRWAAERALELWDGSEAREVSAALRAQCAEPSRPDGRYLLAAARIPSDFVDPAAHDPSLGLLHALRHGIAFDAGITVLLGQPGTGKTIMLNALALRTGAAQAAREMSALSPVLAECLELVTSHRSPRRVVCNTGRWREVDPAWLHGQADPPNCLYLLDAPFTSVEGAVAGFGAMQELVREGCQFVVTMSTIPIRLPSTARIISLDDTF
jgi:HEAT repeat protein